MGNRLSFVFLFFGILLNFQTQAQSSPKEDCEAFSAFKWDDNTKECIDLAKQCRNQGGKWNTGEERCVNSTSLAYNGGCGDYANKSESENGFICTCKHKEYLDDEFYTRVSFHSPPYEESYVVEKMKICPQHAPTTRLLDPCGSKAKPDESIGTSVCVCNNKWPADSGKINTFDLRSLPGYAEGNPDNVCPPENFMPQAQSQQSSCLTALDRLENENIKSYSNVAEETIQTCDSKSRKNEDIQRNVSGAADTASALLQNSAVNSGSVDKCRQAGLLSNAAGYGIGMINTNCSKEYNQCKVEKNKYFKYENESEVYAYCQANEGIPGLRFESTGISILPDAVGATPGTNKQAYDDFIARVKRITKATSEANLKCSDQESRGENKTAGSLLKGTTAAVGSYVSASQQAAACEQALANTQSFVPLTMNCALSGGVNCPVNCVTNPSDPKCKSVSSTGGSQMAGGTNKLDTSSLATGLGTGATGSATGGGSGLDLSSLNNGSGSSAEAQKLEASGAMFGSAGAASAGGAGGTAAASANAAGGTEAGDEGSSQGGIGGAFKALRSAAGNLFNGSGLFGSRANSDKKAPSNNLANKGNTSLIRGLANANRNSCFIDSKGQSFCFGPKHKSIFDIMSTQYANQTPSLLRD